MPRLAPRFLLIASLVLLLDSAAHAQSPTTRPGCTADTSVQVCVTSAALTYHRYYDVGDESVQVVVSVTLRVANTTDYPIGLAILEDGWAFTPQNSSTLVPPSQRPEVSGLIACRRSIDCPFATVAPGGAALVQLTYSSDFEASGLPLVQIARTASFSASLFVSERGSDPAPSNASSLRVRMDWILEEDHAAEALHARGNRREATAS